MTSCDSSSTHCQQVNNSLLQRLNSYGCHTCNFKITLLCIDAMSTKYKNKFQYYFNNVSVNNSTCTVSQEQYRTIQNFSFNQPVLLPLCTLFYNLHRCKCATHTCPFACLSSLHMVSLNVPSSMQVLQTDV